MVFPMETEERVKSRALATCQEHLRKVVDIARKVPQMVDLFVKGDLEAARQLFLDIRKAEEEVDMARRAVSKELAEIGAILSSREDFLRFTNLASEIADYCEGIAFRLLEIMERKWKVPETINEGLVKLSDAFLEAVLKLRETALTLSYGPSKTLEKAKEVEIAERAADNMYRELELKLLEANLEIPVLILLRDVIQLMEDGADKAEDSADAARILSFGM
ncbi:hypothetical protein DRO54_00165 [Candidatus Bathyarchaeota archaeon]|nr:MAG: hypothetical protein DRO54_00165 [Candidatus Bathyarchaeota archaeon]